MRTRTSSTPGVLQLGSGGDCEPWFGSWPLLTPWGCGESRCPGPSPGALWHPGYLPAAGTHPPRGYPEALEWRWPRSRKLLLSWLRVPRGRGMRVLRLLCLAALGELPRDMVGGGCCQGLEVADSGSRGLGSTGDTSGSTGQRGEGLGLSLRAASYCVTTLGPLYPSAEWADGTKRSGRQRAPVSEGACGVLGLLLGSGRGSLGGLWPPLHPGLS